jgi:hypothetical protein
VISAAKDQEIFDPIEPTVRLFAPFSGENAYLRSQKGCFTHIDGGEKWFLHNGEWPAVEHVLLTKQAKETGHDVIRAVKFRKTLVKDLLSHLWRRGVNPGTLRQTMESAAEAARLKWFLESPDA